MLGAFSNQNGSVAAIVVLAAMLVSTLLAGRTNSAPENLPTTFAAAPVTENPAPAAPGKTPAAPANTHTKTKAGFLAGAGLLILSLLGLGTALALVRAFRR